MRIILNHIMIVIFIFASSPNEALGFCFEDCEDSILKSDLISDIPLSSSNKAPSSSSHPNHDCTCPIHSHHCCNHVSLFIAGSSAEFGLDAIHQAAKYSYVEILFLEPFIDGPFKPPIS